MLRLPRDRSGTRLCNLLSLIIYDPRIRFPIVGEINNIRIPYFFTIILIINCIEGETACKEPRV